jgi:hypothetical protein
MRLVSEDGPRRRTRIVRALVALVLFPFALRAQLTNNGGLDLLLPIGARATAMGTAFVAEQGGEAIWWNPAGLAAMTRPEFTLDHSETIVIQGSAASFILPARPVGVFALSARIFDFGESNLRDSADNDIGVAQLRTFVLGATFAADFGPSLAAGVTFHTYVGQSGTDNFTTSAIDLGVQFRPIPSAPLRLGFAMQNFGLSLQVRDRPQSDPLPKRLHFGASYERPIVRLPADVRLCATAEVVTDAAFRIPELRVGSQVGYTSGASHLFLRGGLVRAPAPDGSTASNPSYGFGIANGRVALDFARVIDSFSSDLGTPPTYISIRVGL